MIHKRALVVPVEALKRFPNSKRYLATKNCVDEWNSIITAMEPDAKATSLTYTVKDNILTKSLTTCGSQMLSTFESPLDATVVRILSAKQFSLIGKTNLDQFGMGSSNTNTIYGASANPLFASEDEPYITGGSSGGSAAAVAARLCDFSLGTDTGGSVRLPASNCGIYGFKPTYGRISRWGVIPYAQTLDTVGILAEGVDTIRTVFECLDVEDKKDPTSMPHDLRCEIDAIAAKRDNIKNGKFTIGIPREFLVQELTEEARSKLVVVAELLADVGHTIVEMSVPSIERSLSAYYTIATAEAASNLARYDGVRYGDGHEGTVEECRTNGLGSEVQRRVILGNYTISSGSGDHYARATELRKQLVEEFNEVLAFPNLLISEQGELQDGCDFLISPTTISKPVKINTFLTEESKNLLESYTNDILTTPVSLAGLPAISIPVKDADASISTQGLQVIGQYGDDKGVLGLAKQIMSQLS